VPKEAIGVAEFFARERSPELALGTLERSEADCTLTAIALSYPLAYLEQIKSAVASTEISPELLLAIVRTESHFDPKAISRSGAIGLAQLMPTTAKLEGLTTEQDLYNETTNLQLSAKHLQRLFNQFSNSLPFSVAAYNAGASAVNRWRTRFPDLEPLLWVEMIGFPETRDYVKKVTVAKAVYRDLLSGKIQQIQPLKSPTDN
jgi:soluble lytic murein transglycosylase